MARRQLETVRVSGGDYTGVGERVLSFREDHPNSKIVTKLIESTDGEVTFKTYLWKDKKEVSDLLLEAIRSGMSKEQAEELILLSADSEASSKGELKEKKSYEKQETISLGRALAYQGYSGNGQIASSEEMEAFIDFKEDKLASLVEYSIEMLSSAKSIEELQAIWIDVDKEAKKNAKVVKAKDDSKEKLLNASK